MYISEHNKKKIYTKLS